MFSTLRGRLIGLGVAVVVIAMLAMAVADYATARTRTLAMLDGHVRQLADRQAATLGDWAAQRRAQVAALRHAAGLAQPQALLKAAAQAGGFDNAYIGYADKRVVASSDAPLPRDYDPTARAWYREPLQAGGAIVTAPYVDAGRATLVVTFAEPAPHAPGTAPAAVLAADVSLSKVVEQVLALRPTPHSYAFLVDRDGRVIAHPQRERTLLPVGTLDGSLSRDVLAALGRSGSTLQRTLGGRDGTLFVTTVPGTGWMLVLVLDMADATAGFGAMLLTTAIIAAGCGLGAAVVLFVVIARELRSLGLVRDALARIADGDGDLTRRLDEDGPAELAQIGRAFNRFADQISGVLRQIRAASEAVRLAAADIAGGNSDLSGRTEAQAGALEQTASAMQVLTTNVQGTAVNARTASELAVGAAQAAGSGGSAVRDVVLTMDDIRACSGRMTEIIGAIDGLAFQTNILALNAAVEAARAGDHGRSFAVVAAEVRALAQSSAAAACEIRALIEDTRKRVEAGSRLALVAGQHMEHILGTVRQVADLMGAISTASQDQSTDIAEVNRAIGCMDEVTQRNAALVSQASVAADSMEDQAVALAGVAGRFKLPQVW